MSEAIIGAAFGFWVVLALHAREWLRYWRGRPDA